MSIDPTQSNSATADPRSSYLAALSVAEHIVGSAPVVPQSLDIRSYGEWKYGRYGIAVHLRRPAEVAAFARWIGAHVTTSPRKDGRYSTEALGEYHGTPFQAWALHSDGQWVQRQQAKVGELAAQAHAYYDLDTDSAAVLPGCVRDGYLPAAADAEVSA